MQQTIFVPYLRSSPVHIPRRDLVLSASDSLSLRVTVIESDDPSAQLLTITGGVGGPSARMVIWVDYGAKRRAWNYGASGWYRWYAFDYGWYGARPGSMLYTADGTPQPGLGSFDFFVPFMTFGSFPPRCGWAIALAWDSGRKSELLSRGTLHIGRPDQEMAALTALFSDSWQPITTDADEQLFT